MILSKVQYQFRTKLFWRSCEIIFDHKPISQNDKTKKEINNGTLKIFEGDEIDSKESDEPIEVTLTDIVNIKVIIHLISFSIFS